MKKSVKSLLLALMVLCLSASVGFAVTSADVTISVDVQLKGAKVTDVTVSPDTIHFASEDGNEGKTKATVDVKNTSKDISKIDLVLDIKTVLASVDEGQDKYAVSVDTFIVSGSESSHKDATGSIASQSIEIIVSEDATLKIPLKMVLSSETSLPFEFELTVNVSADFTAAAPTTGAFDSVTITATDSSKDTFTVSVVSTDVSFDLASADYATVSKDLKDKSSSYTAAAGSISFALTGTSSASIKAVYSLSGDVATEITASSGAYASTISEDVTTTFVFVFASGDKFGGVKFDVKGSSSSSTEGGNTYESVTEELSEAQVQTITTGLGWTSKDIVDYADAVAEYFEGTTATITDVTSTDSGVIVLTIEDATGNEYVGIPAVNGTIPVLVSNGVMSLPTSLTPAALATAIENLTGATVADMGSFYKTVFPSNFFDDSKNAPEAEPENEVTGTNGGVTSFTGTLKNALPYGTIILVFLQPTAADATEDDDIQGAMVHSGTAGGESKLINFALANVSNVGGTSTEKISAIALPFTEEYDVGYSTPDGNGALSGTSVEDESFEVAAAVTASDSGSLAQDIMLEGAEKEDVEGSNKGSSSGCDAGFGALALLAIVPFIRKIRK